jgi:hypothetical protein
MFRKAGSCLVVIPANAGIQLNMRAKHSKAILCPADGISELDSGVRRNDGDARSGSSNMVGMPT